MSKPKVFEKPIGFKDYLPNAVKKLRAIEHKVLNCMEGWGYEQIITPTMEFYDTVGAASATSDGKLFKLLNNRGTTMVLRSDMTTPIARVVSSLLKHETFPLRLSYHANVFRSIEEEAGREAEFFQTGVELVGDASAEADAEVVALAIASLKAAGVKQFKIAIGHVGFLNGVLEEALPNRAGDQAELKEMLLSRNYVGYRELLGKLELAEELRQELMDLLRLRGGEEICQKARSVSNNETAQQAINHLCQIWDCLKAYGVCEHVLIDLTMVGDFSYYTGMTFEGYAADLGFPVVSGGRYDNLLTGFNRPAPATGFALKTTRILELVGNHEQEERTERLLIAYVQSGSQQALEAAQELRGQGVQVVTVKVSEQEAWEQLQASAQAGGNVIYNGKSFSSVKCYGSEGGSVQ